ncbi:tetratricopeptide repeat protein, partial [Psychrobacter aquimaris]
MTFLNTSLIRKSTLCLTVAMLSLSACAVDFDETQRLANQSVASAQTNLGVMYYNGEGVPQNYTKALDWYT